jgi:hypothetical protein
VHVGITCNMRVMAHSDAFIFNNFNLHHLPGIRVGKLGFRNYTLVQARSLKWEWTTSSKRIRWNGMASFCIKYSKNNNRSYKFLSFKNFFFIILKNVLKFQRHSPIKYFKMLSQQLLTNWCYYTLTKKGFPLELKCSL